MALFAERAADLACDLYGSDEQFYFWMDDHFDSHCHCPKCQELSPSDQQMLAIHAMLLAIRKRIPNARMAYLAYFDSIVPPKSVKPEQGVFLEYAPFEKYTAKNRADGQRSESAEALIAKEWAMLDPLLELFGQKDAKVLEYWYDNSMFSHWKKPPKPFTLNREGMVRDVKAYRQKGFSSIATFACFLGEDYDALYGETDITPFAKAINASESETV